MEEYEIKFLEVDLETLEKKFLKIGAIKTAEYDYRRVIFDHPGLKLDEDHAFVRLRTDGTECTLTYKQQLGVKSNDGSIPDDGMKEVEVRVDNFENTYELLMSLGFTIKQKAWNKRVRYTKGDVVFDIDFWPELPTYMEIESTSYEKVKAAARELDLDPEKGLICSVKQVYKKYGYDLDDYLSITFEDGLVLK